MEGKNTTACVYPLAQAELLITIKGNNVQSSQAWGTHINNYHHQVMGICFSTWAGKVIVINCLITTLANNT